MTITHQVITTGKDRDITQGQVIQVHTVVNESWPHQVAPLIPR